MWYKVFTPGRRPTTGLRLRVPMGTSVPNGIQNLVSLWPALVLHIHHLQQMKGIFVWLPCCPGGGGSGLRGGCRHDKEVLLLWQHAPSSHQHRSAAEYSAMFPTINKAKRERETRPECLGEEGRGVGGKSQEVVGANKPLLW